MDDRLDASPFISSSEFYEKEFENILSGIVLCYKIMIEDNVIIPNNENEIRDILLLNYLKNKNVKRKTALTNYRFDREIPEDYTKGRVDIRIISKNNFEIDEAYYIIECKRLDNKNTNGISGLNAEYIKEGIMRFINKYYSSYYQINGMIGFIVEKMDIPENILNINELLKNKFSSTNTIISLTPMTFIKEFKYQYYSRHKDNKKNKIKLYHLMFDFSDNIKMN